MDGELEERLNTLPGKVFSGKKHPLPETKVVFFCYARPARDKETSTDGSEEVWSIEAGDVQWYLYDIENEQILEDAVDIGNAIRSEPETPRICAIEQKTLGEIRAKMERHIKNTYLKRVQAPIGVKAILKAWMELN